VFAADFITPEFAHADGAEQIADGIVSRKTIHVQQRVQRAITLQPAGVREPPPSKTWK
jgi:hypothetical protein